MSRINSYHTQRLSQFADDETLQLCLKLQCANIDFTFESKATGNRSTVDHFVISQNFVNQIIQYGAMHDGDNLSDHAPVTMQLTLPNRLEYVDTDDSTTMSKPLWQKASPQQMDMYKCTLDSYLNDIVVPCTTIHCSNVHCGNEDHLQQISDYHDAIVSACLAASYEHIPHSKSSSTSMPGWNDMVKPYRDKSILWHTIWKENGCPKTGLIANIHRQARAQYHLAVKKLKKEGEHMRAQKMADALLHNNSRDFWTEVKKVRKSGTAAPSQIDDKCDLDEITSHFASKYSQVYNSVSYDLEDMTDLMQNFEIAIDEHCLGGNCEHYAITIEDVKKCLMHLKPGKHDGYVGHYTDHMINGTDSLMSHLSNLFSSMILHGYTPDGMSVSTIVSIPKNTRKSINDSTNYRGIALSSAIGKVLDWLLLLSHPDILKSCDLQFAYKEKASSSQCTFVVNETVNYYVNNNSDVHLILLDASKAFDRVQYIKLFNELQRRNLCPLICRFLALQYTLQKCRVKWCNHLSKIFSVTNGVKQGGVLSPILFTIYLDCLLERLRLSGAGCYIGNVFCGSLAYADDLVLLAPTRSSMNRLLGICEAFSDEYKILFNASKSKHIFMSKNRRCAPIPFELGGNAIPTVDSDKHLGNIIGSQALDKTIDANIRELYQNVNVLLSQFPKVNLNTKYKLFKTFCMSVYGSQLWDFESKACEKFYTAWRKCVRRLLNLPYKTHCSLLHLICDDLSVNVQLYIRCINFVKTCVNSKMASVKMCCNIAMKGSNSALCNSVSHVCHKLDIKDIREVSIPALKCRESMKENEQNKQKAGLIRDFIEFNEDLNDIDVKHIIEDICVN